MKERLYHGSNRIVDKPEYGLGKPYNDYGRGFYCTKEFNLAGEWAVASDRDGYINEYLLTTDKLRILNLNDSGYCILDWLVHGVGGVIVLAHRPDADAQGGLVEQ